jgi:uncharacterized protein YpmB
MTVFWVVLIIALMMAAASTYETSVNFYQNARRNNQKTAIFILAAVRTSNLTHTHSVFENKATKIIFGPKRKDATGDIRHKVHN